jgi:hypothetical protein
LRTSAADERHVAAPAIVPQNILAVSVNAKILAIIKQAYGPWFHRADDCHIVVYRNPD